MSPDFAMQSFQRRCRFAASRPAGRDRSPKAGIVMLERVLHGIAGLALAVAAITGHATIIGLSTETFTEVQVVNSEDGTLRSTKDGLNAGTFDTVTLPVFTPPSGAPFDTSGRPAVLAASQSLFGFNSVFANGFFSNGAQNTLESRAHFRQIATGNRGDAVGVNYLVFPGRLGITCYSNVAPATVSDIVSVCHPSVGTRVELAMDFSVERGGLEKIGNPRIDSMTAGLRMEVVADPNAPFGTRIDVTQLGSTQLAFHLGFSSANGFPPMVTLEIEGLSGALRAGIVNDDPFEYLAATYEMTATVEVTGPETGGLAQIADPFALNADPLGYFRTFFPDAELPGFRLGDAGPLPPNPVPVSAPWLLWLAGAGGFTLLGRGKRRSPG